MPALPSTLKATSSRWGCSLRPSASPSWRRRPASRKRANLHVVELVIGDGSYQQRRCSSSAQRASESDSVIFARDRGDLHDDGPRTSHGSAVDNLRRGGGSGLTRWSCALCRHRRSRLPGGCGFLRSGGAGFLGRRLRGVVVLLHRFVESKIILWSRGLRLVRRTFCLHRNYGRGLFALRQS